MPVADFVPAESGLQRRFQDAQHSAVHVILGDAEEQQSADYPAESACEKACLTQNAHLLYAPKFLRGISCEATLSHFA